MYMYYYVATVLHNYSLRACARDTVIGKVHSYTERCTLYVALDLDRRRLLDCL